MTPRAPALAALAVALAVAPPAARAQRFRRPFDNHTAVLYGYDNNRGGGGCTDYNCGGRCYDGHTGSDFPVGLGTTIVAAADGRVVATNNGCPNYGFVGNACGGRCGNYVFIQHPDGNRSVYCHLQLNSLMVRVGDGVRCGQPIARSASSGSSSGPHLHLSWRRSSGDTDAYRGRCTSSPGVWVQQNGYAEPVGAACEAPPPPPTCAPRCEGAVLVGADCGRTDCAGAGASCRADGGPPRCVPNPRGALDAAECDAITGWAQDPAAPSSPIAVDVYFDGPAGSGAAAVRVTAGARREDLCGAIGSCDHGFALETPARLRDGRAHAVYAYAIAAPGGAVNPLLGGSPRTLRCATARAADVNGDGRDDVVQYRSDWRSVPVCLSLGTGWSCRNAPAPTTDAWPGGVAGSAVLDGASPLVGMFNDDPRADLFQYRADADRLPVCLSLGTGWSCRGLVPWYVGGDYPAGNAGHAVYPGGAALVGDVNGDGRDDVVQHGAEWRSLPVCLSLATGWSCRNLAATLTGGTALLGDVNGDGRADVIEHRDGATALNVCLSLGTGWSCRALPAALAGGTPLVGDVNGDGRADLIEYRDRGTSFNTCLSLGTGWSCRALPATYAGGDHPAGNEGSAVYAGGTALVGDFNGDGRADVAQYAPGWQSLPLCLSLGTGWSCRNLRAHHVGGDLPAGNEGSGIYRGGAPLAGDFNGDGRADIAQHQPRGWEGIPVCLYTGSGWSCRNLRAHYAGGLGAGNGGSGVY